MTTDTDFDRPDVLPDEWPGNWKFAGGNISTPVKSGYYTTVVTLHEWENQHRRQYLEARMYADSQGSNGPRAHWLRIERRLEDSDTEQALESDVLVTDRVTIAEENRNLTQAQIEAERKLYEKAVAHMDYFTPGDEPSDVLGEIPESS